MYSITTTTRYNAAGQPLISGQKRLISEPSPTLESKSVFVCERGLTSTQWSEYSAGTKRVQYSTMPTSSITAETVTVGGVVLSQKDTAGITTTATRPPAIQKDGSWFTYGWDLIAEQSHSHLYIYSFNNCVLNTDLHGLMYLKTNGVPKIIVHNSSERRGPGIVATTSKFILKDAPKIGNCKLYYDKTKINIL